MRSLVTVSLLLAVTATAADKSAPAPEKSAPAPVANATAVARKDFEEIKAARGLPGTTGAELPRLSTPELNLGSGAPTPSASRLDPALAAQKKSANWLVDAMMEKPKKGNGPEAADKLTDRHGLDSETSSETTPDKEKTPEKSKRMEPVINPLESYMASWVSPQDLSLVRSIMREQNADGAADPLLAQISATAGPGGYRDAPAPFGTSAAATGMPSAPRENPFLQLLNTPPPANTGMLAAPAPVTAPVVQAAPPAPLLTDPAAATKSTIPSFVKPRDDEKFNKQMKRF